MNARKIKTILMDNGLSVADIARELCVDYPHVKEKSMYSMIYGMMFGGDFYPEYAAELKSRYGIIIKRPASVREQLKAA